MIKENLIEYIESGIKQGWNSDALTDYQGSTITYGDLARKITTLHLLFERIGVKPGDKISLLGKNSTSWGVVYLATVSYGAVMVPILPDFRPSDIEHIINHSDSTILFVADSLFAPLKPENMPNLRAIISLDTQTAFTAENEKIVADTANQENIFNNQFPSGITADSFTLPKVDNSQLAVISYTSGTTGFSK